MLHLAGIKIYLDVSALMAGYWEPMSNLPTIVINLPLEGSSQTCNDFRLSARVLYLLCDKLWSPEMFTMLNNA